MRTIVKRTVFWALLVLGLGTIVAYAGGHRIEINHKGKVISIPESAWPAHEAHGDSKVIIDPGGGAV